jgi:hypothetical protein
VIGCHDGQASSRPIVLALARRQGHHLTALQGSGRYRLVLDETWKPDLLHTLRPALLLTMTDSWFEADVCIRKAKALGIPTLLLMDGILEWRHEWEDPQMGAVRGVPLMQPVTTDRVACIGRQSVRLLESWGNLGKCELVGCPRLDDYIVNPVRSKPKGGRRTLLVATATTPAFTDSQWHAVLTGLRDVAAFLAATDGWIPEWRVCDRARKELKLPEEQGGKGRVPIRQALEFADAVLTTPSTVQVEAMLADRPTALLDYGNSPHYVGAAWSISARDHIGPVLAGLAEPSGARLAHQATILNDCLECATPAGPRLDALVSALVSASPMGTGGQRAAFPWPVLPRDLPCTCPPLSSLELARLYPQNEVFQFSRVADLQRRLLYSRMACRYWRRQATMVQALRSSVSVIRRLRLRR